QGLALQERVIKDFPTLAVNRLWLIWAYKEHGDLLTKAGRAREAREVYLRALEHYERLDLKPWPLYEDLVRDRAGVWLAERLAAVGCLNEAERAYRLIPGRLCRMAEYTIGEPPPVRLGPSKLCSELARQLNDQGRPQESEQVLAVVMIQLADARRLVELDGKLLQFLNGQAKPADTAEHLSVAVLCQGPDRERYAAAVRFYAEAFALDPSLADATPHGDRYNAACAAALAGAGLARDDYTLSAVERASWLRQARAWLRADLAQLDKQIKSGKPQALQDTA